VCKHQFTVVLLFGNKSHLTSLDTEFFVPSAAARSVQSFADLVGYLGVLDPRMAQYFFGVEF